MFHKLWLDEQRNSLFCFLLFCTYLSLRMQLHRRCTYLEKSSSEKEKKKKRVAFQIAPEYILSLVIVSPNGRNLRYPTTISEMIIQGIRV